MVKPKHSFNIQLYKHSCDICDCLAVSSKCYFACTRVGVIYHRMDDIVQCLFNLYIK